MSKIPEDFKEGSIFETNSWGLIEVLKWHRHTKVLVKFLDTGNTDFHAAGDIRRKEVKDRKAWSEQKVKVGDKFKSNDGSLATVVKYVTNKEVTVKFDETQYEMTTHLNNIRSGCFKDQTKPNIFGVGFLGTKAKEKPDSRNIGIWHNMLKRCYDEDSEYFHLYGGRGVKVHEVWHNFQNFSQWANGVQYRQDGWQLDKDILNCEDVKVYSPKTCCFVPPEINGIVTEIHDKQSKLPNGVDFNKQRGKYRARVCLFGKTETLGYGDDPMELFHIYKTAKEDKICTLANNYKDQLDPRVYEKLLSWKVSP